MIRSEAIKQAVEMAVLAGDMARRADSNLARGAVAVGELWLGLSDRLPVEEEVRPDGWTPPATDDDEGVVMQECGHGILSWLNRGQWLHPDGMRVCDNPPVGKGPER